MSASQFAATHAFTCLLVLSTSTHVLFVVVCLLFLVLGVVPDLLDVFDAALVLRFVFKVFPCWSSGPTRLQVVYS